MKVEVRRKIFSVIMAMSVFISALAMPVFFRAKRFAAALLVFIFGMIDSSLK